MARGRYAPSPTGRIHLGNASTALVSWLSVRARGGTYVMRIEDLDSPRVVPGALDALLGDLAWLGLDWDEGPYVQSDRRPVYDAAFETLRREGHVYPCFCSRRDIQAAASAPQVPGDEVVYPETCRAVDPAVAAARIARGDAHAFRFRVDGDPPGFDDRVAGRFDPPPGSIGDFVVRRADGVPAYQLAVVADDAAMEIDEVVRARDLLASTSRQLLIYDALGRVPPSFAHVPLLLGPDGVRLSKRHHGVTLAELREAGVSAEAIVGRLAHLLGLRKTEAPVEARALADGFDLDALGGVTDRIV
ncbi:MAG TPA: tRNA glutamyl-Q(34) synthetase GluQRS [Candidatus Polarisedimenticolaceae bacterium]|nr:tRNA glutamyl-Q(34) synthetase GluQRS [Candidatus Polarisedimenticolaceae bacterium]